MDRLKMSLLLLLTLLLLVADVLLGGVALSVEQVWNALIGRYTESIDYEIVLYLRLPKAITALLVGAALSVSGVMMQTLFRNPLAGPDLLGINSGAGLGVALVTMLSASTLFALSFWGSWLQIGAAIAGALLSMLLILLVSLKVKRGISLLIVGLMLGYLTGAVVSVLQSISNPDAVKLFIVWTFGSLSSVSWSYLGLLAPVLLLSMVVCWLLQKPMDALLLGDRYAAGLGISVFKIRVAIIILTALLSGASTAFVGPIAFIGVTVPHIARALFDSASHRLVLPGAMLIGGSLLLLCDIITFLPSDGSMLPINAICALFGAPIILWIIVRGRHTDGYFD